MSSALLSVGTFVGGRLGRGDFDGSPCCCYVGYCRFHQQNSSLGTPISSLASIITFHHIFKYKNYSYVDSLSYFFKFNLKPNAPMYSLLAYIHRLTAVAVRKMIKSVSPQFSIATHKQKLNKLRFIVALMIDWTLRVRKNIIYVYTAV